MIENNCDWGFLRVSLYLLRTINFKELCQEVVPFCRIFVNTTNWELSEFWYPLNKFAWLRTNREIFVFSLPWAWSYHTPQLPNWGRWSLDCWNDTNCVLKDGRHFEFSPFTGIEVERSCLLQVGNRDKISQTNILVTEMKYKLVKTS